MFLSLEPVVDGVVEVPPIELLVAVIALEVEGVLEVGVKKSF